MKKNTIQGILLAAGIFLLAVTGCKDRPDQQKEPMKESDYRGQVFTDTVRLTSAEADIQHYVNTCYKYLGDTVPIRSYSINKSDLFGVLGVTSVPDCAYDHCRVYIGLTSENKFKLYMTPTEWGPAPNNPKDSLYKDKIPYDSVHRCSYLYDLNAPCPSTCDKFSKLYKVRN